MALELTPRQRRWLDALLILSTIAVGFVVVGFAGGVFAAFGDIILVFFLAWLLTFILAPAVRALTRLIPFLPRALAVVVVYTIVIGGLILLLLVVANALVVSIRDFVASLPEIRRDLPEIMAPWQARADALGLAVDLTRQAETFLSNINNYLETLAGPLQQLAVASLGVLGNILFVVILSIYMAVDQERIFSYLYRLVPRGAETEARLLQVSVYRSFGGFLRGQAAMGVIYAVVAGLTSTILGLGFAPVTTAASGFLMAIPFFGPFVSWVPPVLVAVLFHPESVVPALILMGAGWFLAMNAIQPRLMQEAVGLHPVVVLGSVIVGARIAGIPGAIFGIPVAAVLAAFFAHYYALNREAGTVAERAAQLVESREGRQVRVPREPKPGVDPEIPDDPDAQTNPS